MVIGGLWSRVTGGDSESQVQQDLKKLTNSEVIDVPKDLLQSVSQASYNADDRQVIMQHLRECLAEPNNKRWRRIYAGLVLVETLIDKGCPQLIAESAEGVHFDLVQRLSFLEKFDFSSDMRVQRMVTGKATALRALMIEKQQSCDPSITGTVNAPSSPSNGAAFGGTSSAQKPVSNGVFSSSGACPVTSYSSDGPRPVEESKKGRTVVNGIVSVGHRDDTTSESEGEQDRRRRQEKRGDERPSRRKKSDRDRRRRSSSDTSSASSGGSGRRRRDNRSSRQNGSAPAAPPPPPAPTANLLDF